MTTPKERFTDEAVAAAVAERDAAHAESVAKMANELQKLRAELTAARTVGLENYNRACRERDEARAALAQARADALEEAAKVCDAEFDTRNANMARADAGSLEWGPDPKRSATIQGHKAVTAIGLAKAIRALKPTPTTDR